MTQNPHRYGAALAAAFLLYNTRSASAETIGINFQDDFGNGDGGAAVTTEPAFGIPADHWYNMPRVLNSITGPVASSTSIIPPGGLPLLIEWSARNTYSLTGEVPTSAGEDPGADQVVYGYLDDSAPGYRVRLSGLRNTAANYKITLIASSDSASGFTDASLVHSSGTDTLVYGVPDPGTTVPALGGGSYALTPPSESISGAEGNNDVVITAAPRVDLTRATLAGIIIEYTPGTANKPIIETQPQAPVGTVYTGDTVTFTAAASGAPFPAYQWRKGGVPLPGKTEATLTISPAAVTDSGDYDVVATNSAGSATSDSVTLSVSQLAQPVFTAAPASQELYRGYPAVFSSTVTGGELTYSWKKGDTVIPGATGPTLSLASIAEADSGTYTLTATNARGSATATATLTVVIPEPDSYEAIQVSQRPLLWYRYSETTPLAVNTGTAANSGSVGAAGAGTAKRYVAFQTPGALAGDSNTAAGLKSNNQFIDIPYNAELNPEVFTAEFWVKPPPVNNGLITPLVNRGKDAGDGFLFFGWNTVTKWQFRCYDKTTRTQVNSEVDIVPGKWTHLVGTYDGTTARLYVDGVEQGTGTEGTYFPNDTMPMRLGGWPNDNGDTGGGNFAGGAVDEVAIYSTVLTPAQIVAHYENGIDSGRSTPYSTLVQSSTPKGYWRLDDPAPPVKPAPKNSGTAGNAWTGDYGGDITPGVEGPVPPDQAGFEDDNAAVAMTTHGYNTVPPLNITTNHLTVTTWVKRAEVFTTGDLAWPAWLGAGGGFHIDGTGGRPYGEMRYHWDGGIWGTGSGLQVPAEVWTFCAMVLEPNQTTFYMSEEGALKKSVITTTNSPHTLSEPISFGGNQTGRADRNFIGQIDESAFYDRALSESEVSALFLKAYGTLFAISATPGGLMEDTKPTGTPVPALNHGAAWRATATDGTKTLAGVLDFVPDSNARMVIPARPELDTATGTIMFWMKSALPTGPGDEAAILFDHRTTSGAILGLAVDSGDLFFQTAPGAANTFSAGTFVADETWHHVAVTWDQSAAGSVSIFVDGTPTANQANAEAWTWPAGQPIEIGVSHDTYWKRYAGMLDDLRVYNTALTAAQISSVVSTGAIPAPESLTALHQFGTAGGGMTLAWPFGDLESSTGLSTWAPVTGATSPLAVPTTGDQLRFYRAVLP